MVKERQTSFSSGELSPTLQGRTDLEQYRSGARTLKNFIVTPHGVVTNRTGTQHLAGPFASGPMRVVPFVYSETDTAVLVFRENKLVIYERVSDAELRFGFASAASDVVTTGYAEEDLAGLRFAQVGNFLYIVSTEYPPKRLVRTPQAGTDLWELETLDLKVPEAPVYDQSSTFHEGSAFQEIPRTEAFVAKRNNGTNQNVQPDLGISNTATVYSLTGKWDESYPDSNPNRDPITDFPAVDWTWAYTYVLRDTTGRVFETQKKNIVSCVRHSSWVFEAEVPPLIVNGDEVTSQTTFSFSEDLPESGTPFVGYGLLGPAITQDEEHLDAWWYDTDDDGFDDRVRCALTPVPDQISVYPERPVTLLLPAQKDDVLPDTLSVPLKSATVVTMRVYRGREGRFGYVGETTSLEFKDDGETPDYSLAPPAGNDPFAAVGDYPGALAFYEGRFIVGGSDNEPGKFFASAVEEWLNFDEAVLPRDNQALQRELSSNRSEIIRALVPRGQLLALTSSAEWGISGSGQQEVITPSSVAARQLSQIGSGKLAPLEVGPSIFTLQQKGTLPKILVPDGRSGLQDIDAGLFSRHLFEGYTIVDWAYAEDPFNTVWVVRSDGALLSLTYIPGQEMLAWAQHELADGGQATSVAVVPEGKEDRVYLTVHYDQDDRVYLERLNFQHLPLTSAGGKDIRYAAYLDRSNTTCGLVEDVSLTITAPVNDDFAAVIIDIGSSTFVDQTAVASSATENDVALDTADDTSAIYFGQPARFNKIIIDNSGGLTLGGTTTWEYFADDSTWKALEEVVDETVSWSVAGAALEVRFKEPADWALTNINAQGYYLYVRGRNGTDASSGDQMWTSNDARLGETVEVTFAPAYTGKSGEKVQIKNSDGIDVVLLLVSEVTNVYQAEVVQAPGDGTDARIPDAMLGTAISDTWGRPVSSVGGLTHLNGQNVTVLADGVVVRDVPVSGNAPLPFNALIATAGLSYDSDFASLDAEQEHNRQKIVKAVTYELEYSRGGKVGEELGDDMRELRGRQVSDDFAAQPPVRRDEKILISGRYDETGRAALRQSEPLPMTILGITRHIEYGGD